MGEFEWGDSTYKYNPASGYELMIYESILYSMPTAIPTGIILTPFLMVWVGTWYLWKVCFDLFDAFQGEASAFWYSSLITKIYVYRNGFDALGGGGHSSH